MYILSLDVAAAFDNMHLPMLDAELARAGVPAVLRLSLLRELSSLQALPTLGPHEGERVAYQRGVRQGGPRTPAAWNRLLQFPLQRLQEQWSRRGDRPLSWCPDFTDHMLIWADNVWLIASDAEGLRRRVEDVVRTFRELHREFSDSSLEVLTSPAARIPAGPWRAGR